MFWSRAFRFARFCFYAFDTSRRLGATMLYHENKAKRMKLMMCWASAAAALLLGGCACKEPMQYLPECPGYMLVYADQSMSQAGLKRLFESSKKAGNPAGSALTEKCSRAYFGFSSFGPQMSIYGVIIGKPGLTPEALSEAKSEGGTETKIDG